MISFIYFLSFLSTSPSIAYIATTVSAITLMFLSHVTEDRKFNKLEKDKDRLETINNMKDQLSIFLKLFPYSHVYRFFLRLLKAELQYPFQIELTYKDFYGEWYSLFAIGVSMMGLIIIKIFIFEKINISMFDQYFSRIFKMKSDKCEILDEDVINETEFTEKNASSTNCILIIKNLKKLYISILRRLTIYACKDVSFSLRNNEVIFFIH